MDELLAAVSKFDSTGMKSVGGGGFSEWAGTFTALFLLWFNRGTRKSALQTSFLVLYLFAAMPTPLFNILRGPFGCWVAFLSIGANLFFPAKFHFARFILFVVMPGWLADGLRGTVAGFIFSLVVVLFMLAEYIIGAASERNVGCNSNFITFLVATGFLLFFLIL